MSVQSSNSSGLLLQTQQELADGTVLVAVVMSLPEDGSSVSLGYGNVSVQVPSAILENIGSGILSVGVMGVTPTSSPVFSLLNSSEGGLQSEILSLDLLVNGTAVTDLVEPLQLTLATSGEPSVCGYLDEDRNEWSTVGVSVVSTADGTLGMPGMLVCAASHLSIFGAILRSVYAALACSNAAAIFSLQGLQSLVKRPSWIIQLSAVLNWLMLMVGAALLVMARRADNLYQEALDVVPILNGLKREKLKNASERQESVWEYLMDGFNHATNKLNIDPVQMAYSKMIKAHTGLSLEALKKLYYQSGHTVLHGRTEAFLQEFEGKHLGSVDLVKTTFYFPIITSSNHYFKHSKWGIYWNYDDLPNSSSRPHSSWMAKEDRCLFGTKWIVSGSTSCTPHQQPPAWFARQWSWGRSTVVGPCRPCSMAPVP